MIETPFIPPAVDRLYNTGEPLDPGALPEGCDIKMLLARFGWGTAETELISESNVLNPSLIVRGDGGQSITDWEGNPISSLLGLLYGEEQDRLEYEQALMSHGGSLPDSHPLA